MYINLTRKTNRYYQYHNCIYYFIYFQQIPIIRSSISNNLKPTQLTNINQLDTIVQELEIYKKEIKSSIIESFTLYIESLWNILLININIDENNKFVNINILINEINIFINNIKQYLYDKDKEYLLRETGQSFTHITFKYMLKVDPLDVDVLNYLYRSLNIIVQIFQELTDEDVCKELKDFIAKIEDTTTTDDS